MAVDSFCRQFVGENGESKHLYGPQVHLIGDAFHHNLLAKFCSPKMQGPILFEQLNICYQSLLKFSMVHSFPRKIVKTQTRMIEHTPHGEIEAEIIDSNVPVVVVDIARAGIYPAQKCYECLLQLIEPSQIRQDHIYINRKVNEAGQVIGNTLSGSKIGGDVAGRILLIPDPMGATGGTLSYVLSHYKKNTKGTPLRMIALHLIVTPEYIRRMNKDFPELEIFALRLDRGLSTEKALASVPGKYPEEEKGLNEFQYIVPGAGGVGEFLNNSYV